MTTNYSKLFKAMSALNDQHRDPVYETPAVPFPFPQIYPQQQTLIVEAKKALASKGAVAFTCHTGFGKTPMFLSLSRSQATIIIEPRKFLQKQCAEYYGDFILFGRSEYPCIHAKNAAVAPCQRKVSCEAGSYHETCPNATQSCLNHPCNIFRAEKQWVKMPCPECQYIKAQSDAAQVLKRGGTVICNFGNFWSLLKHAELVVVDEADLFFKEIAKPTRLEFSTPKNSANETIDSLLKVELVGLEKAKATSPPSQIYSIQNKIYNASFLSGNANLCFKYQRKDKIYIEISPDKIGVLKDKIFKDKKLVIVSATLGEFDIPKLEETIWQRRGIFYAPVGKMTSRELKLKPWMMERAAEQIETMCSLAEGMFDTRQFVIHCGNIGTHATQMNELLGPDRSNLKCVICGERVEDISKEEQEVKCPKCGRKWVVKEEMCTLHERGNLMQTIEKYLESGKRYLLVASAEYGASFEWCTLQFILKYPYPSLDDKMRTLERLMGAQKFQAYYSGDARSRLVQQSGRNSRGFGDFGVTVIMDSKFMEEYRRDKENYPVWFRKAFDEKTY